MYVDLQTVEVMYSVTLFYDDTELYADVSYTNDVPFLTPISTNVHYGIVGAVDDMEYHTLEKELMIVVRHCAVRVFHAVLTTLGTKFKSLKDCNQEGVIINTVDRGDNVPMIECFHRVVEDRCPCHCKTFPFGFFSRQMVVRLLKIAMFCKNEFA